MLQRCAWKWTAAPLSHKERGIAATSVSGSRLATGCSVLMSKQFEGGKVMCEHLFLKEELTSSCLNACIMRHIQCICVLNKLQVDAAPPKPAFNVHSHTPLNTSRGCILFMQSAVPSRQLYLPLAVHEYAGKYVVWSCFDDIVREFTSPPTSVQHPWQTHRDESQEIYRHGYKRREGCVRSRDPGAAGLSPAWVRRVLCKTTADSLIRVPGPEFRRRWLPSRLKPNDRPFQCRRVRTTSDPFLRGITCLPL